TSLWVMSPTSRSADLCLNFGDARLLVEANGRDRHHQVELFSGTFDEAEVFVEALRIVVQSVDQNGTCARDVSCGCRFRECILQKSLAKPSSSFAVIDRQTC